MADSTIEVQGVRLKAHDNGDGTFSLATHNMSGGTGMADTSIDFVGYRVRAHDNGDGTFSPETTTSTGANDVYAETRDGIPLKLHPDGGNVVIGGVSFPTYAIVTYAV